MRSLIFRFPCYGYFLSSLVVRRIYFVGQVFVDVSCMLRFPMDVKTCILHKQSVENNIDVVMLQKFESARRFRWKHLTKRFIIHFESIIIVYVYVTSLCLTPLLYISIIDSISCH